MYRNFNHCLIRFTSFFILLLIIPSAHSASPSKSSYELLQKAADQGFAEAQYNLAWCYAEGIGVTKDITKAVEWYKKAADQGESNAQSALKRLSK